VGGSDIEHCGVSESFHSLAAIQHERMEAATFRDAFCKKPPALQRGVTIELAESGEQEHPGRTHNYKTLKEKLIPMVLAAAAPPPPPVSLG
jgi:hypothetical protein